jgi:hypothetical protein
MASSVVSNFQAHSRHSFRQGADAIRANCGKRLRNAAGTQLSVGYDLQLSPRKDARKTRSALMKNPSKTEKDAEPFNREEWERKHGPLFDDECMDSFLESIYESRGKKLPDYLRRKK